MCDAMTAIESFRSESTSTSSTKSLAKGSTTVTKTTTVTTSYRRSSYKNPRTPFEISVARIRYGKDCHKVAPLKVSLDDIDDLIATLSKEEIEELAMVDPDDTSMPASMRCLYNCDKEKTGDLDRKAMLNTLKETALNTPDKEECVKFVPGTIRGKKFVPKEEASIEVTGGEVTSEDPQDQDQTQQQSALSPEEQRVYDDFFATASIDDIQEMADILGLTYQDDCMATALRKYPDPEPNRSNVDKITGMVEANDPDCVDINLNNIKGISGPQWSRLFAALANNVHVESVTAANCDISDKIAEEICRCVERSRSLRSINLDSNNISGDMVVKLIASSARKQVLEELRVSNQLNCKYLGNRIETEIANLLHETPQLVKLGITMEFRDTLNRTAVQLEKNLDRKRGKAEDKSLMQKVDGEQGPKHTD